MRPTRSGQFEPGTLARVTALRPDGAITRDWAWGGADGAGVRVAVVDSGIDATHPAVGEVAGAVRIGPDPSAPAQTFVAADEPEDRSGHGTACAGIIRATAPRADLYSVRVLDRNLRCDGSVLAAGLRWAIDNGMQVVNLSLSSRKRDHFALLHELADEAYFRGVILVCAINNIDVPSYPSAFASVLSVAAHGGRDPTEIYFNPHPPVEIGAPGIDVEVAWRGGATLRSSGNSYAAAHVSALVARILSKHPGLTPFQMKTVLHAVSTNASA
jgi:subtilisin family serine protease